ncbi:2'-5' RNA ligase [hydrothermal vent metagenome]|uniref:2'-5' RNA ligase n=1 Tax=hydrothermal vent metagenome TaxID=652676 RepID=A0A3B0QKN9_9ZZZZ
MLRAFIAIPLPPEVKRLLTDVQAELQAAATGQITWTRAEVMHLTLRFIGNIEERQIQTIADAMAHATQGVKGFKLTTDGIGAFPDLKNPKLIYIGLGDSCQLTALSDRINAVTNPGTDELKKPPLIKKYHPHLTLCRVRKKGRINGLSGFTERFSGTEGITFNVSEIVLFKSDLTGKSPVYTTLRCIALG